MYVTLWIPTFIGICFVCLFVGMIVTAARANNRIDKLESRNYELQEENVNLRTHGKALKGL